MDHLRFATPEEVVEIQKESDITPRSIVYCLGNQKAVVRNVFEVDPLYSAGASVGPLAKFIWGLEERMIGSGVDAYYFEIDADDAFKPWRDLVEHWGAEPITAKPSIRYKKVLVR